MSIWTYRGMLRENELSLFGKSAIVLLVAWIAFGATVNIARSEVRHPAAFFVVIVGIVLSCKNFGHITQETGQFWSFAYD